MSLENVQPTSGSFPPIGRPVRERRRPILGPVILIGLGLLFLAQSFGWLPGDVWMNIWRLWPVLLILAGVELIFGRSNWATTIAVVLVVLVTGAVVTAAAFSTQVAGWSPRDWSFGVAGPAGVEHVIEELGDARRAEVKLSHGAGTIELGALPANSSQIIDASLAYGPNAQVEHDIDRDDGTVSIDLQGGTRGNGINFGNSAREDWTVNLSPNLPIDLTVESGASDVRLNLRELTVTRLDVEAGASGVHIILPQAAGQTEAQIKAGAAGVEITVPEGVAARIRARGGLSGTTIDQARFPQNGDVYQSPDYASASNRVDLSVDTGVSGVTIH